MGNTVGTERDPSEWDDSGQGVPSNRLKREPSEDLYSARIIKTTQVNSPQHDKPETIEIVIPAESVYPPSSHSLSNHSISSSYPPKPGNPSAHDINRRNTLSTIESPLKPDSQPLFAGTGQFTKRLSLQHSGIPYFDSRSHRRNDPEAPDIMEPQPRKASLYDTMSHTVMMPFLSRKQTSAPESAFYDHKAQLARPLMDGLRLDIPSLSTHPPSMTSPPLPVNTYSAPPPLQEPSMNWQPTGGSLLALNPTLHVSQTDLTQTKVETLYLTESETVHTSPLRSLHSSPPPPPKLITAAQVALLPPYPFLSKSSENSTHSQQNSGVDTIPIIPIRTEKRLQKSSQSIEKLKLSSYFNQNVNSTVISPEEEPIDAQPPKLPRYLLREGPSRSSSHHSLHKDDSRRNSVDNYDLKKKALKRHAWAAQNSSSHSSFSSNMDLAKSSTSLLIPRPPSHLLHSKSNELRDKEGSNLQTPIRPNTIKILNASTDVLGLSSLSLNKGSKDSFQSLWSQFDTRPKKKDFFKCNSCSTLFVDYTLIKNDLDETLKCASVYLHEQIYHNTVSMNTKSHEMLSEMIHPLSKHIQFCTQIPTAEDIFKYLECLFHAAELNVECAIITLIYIERLLKMGQVHLQVINWARIVLGGILLASKVWDDHAVWNVDYCQIFPDVTVTEMNELERYILEQIEFDVSVKASHYAKAYFELRKLSAGKGRKRSFKPLNIKEVHKFDGRNGLPSEDSIKDLRKSDSEAQEIELNLMESGVDRVAATSRKFSAATLATAVTAATSVPRSSAIHGQHILPEEATAVVNAERSIRRAMSDYIFVSSKPPATVV